MSDTGDTTPKADFLGKKVGPFKGQTWVIVIGGVLIVGYMLYRKTHATSTATLTTDSFTNPNADSIPSQAGGASAGTVNTPNGNPSSFTNAQWALNASNQLIAQGDDPTTVSNALSKYMNGGQLSAAEAAIVAVALTAYGEPPQGVIPVNSGSTTTTTAPSSSNNGSDPVVAVLQDGQRMFSEFASGAVQYIGDPNQAAQELGTTGQSGSGQSIYSQYVRDNTGAVWGLAQYTTPGVAGYGSTGTTAGEWYHLSPDEYRGLGTPAFTQVASAPTAVLGTSHTYTSLTGDTAANISQRFLGTSDTAKLLAANPGLSGTITPGTVINIPAS